MSRDLLLVLGPLLGFAAAALFPVVTYRLTRRKERDDRRRQALEDSVRLVDQYWLIAGTILRDLEWSYSGRADRPDRSDPRNATLRDLEREIDVAFMKASDGMVQRRWRLAYILLTSWYSVDSESEANKLARNLNQDVTALEDRISHLYSVLDYPAGRFSPTRLRELVRLRILRWRRRNGAPPGPAGGAPLPS